MGTLDLRSCRRADRGQLDAAKGDISGKTTGLARIVTPHGDRSCRFLLTQGVGEYDRHPIDPKTWEG
jgi:hypothetical protein